MKTIWTAHSSVKPLRSSFTVGALRLTPVRRLFLDRTRPDRVHEEERS